MEAQDLDKIGAQTQEAMEIVFSFVPALVLKSALLLQIPDIIAREGPTASLSVHQIAARLPTQNPHLDYLSRILRYLSTKGVFLQSPVDDDVRYSLTDTAKRFFVKEKNSSSLVTMVMLFNHETVMAAWHHLHDSVLEGCHAFQKANGKDIYACGKEDPHLNNIINDFTASVTMASIDQIVKCYEGFKDLKSMADVGGGNGTALAAIVKAHPHIHGINFDQPHVVATAAPIPGIEHVGGDMFHSVPSADAILLKHTLLDWDDESCMKMLKNCHEALPENGKLILVDSTLPDEWVHSDSEDVFFLGNLTATPLRRKHELCTLLQNSSFSILNTVWLSGESGKLLMVEATKSNKI